MLTKLKRLVKNNFFIVLCIISLFYIAPALYKPSQSNEKALVTAIGVDRQEDEYEVSMLIVVPNQPNGPSSDSVELVSSNGSTIAEAINGVSLNIGKKIGLAHCDAIIVSDKVLEEDLHATLDYLNRSGELTKNAMLLNTPESSKDALKSTISTKSVPSLKLSSVVQYNKDFAFETDASVDSFYADYYTPSSVSLVPIITVTEQDEAASNVENSSSSSSSSSGSSGEQKPKILQCKGDICVLKHGKRVSTITGEELKAYNVLRPQTKRGFVYLTDVNGGVYKNAKITLEIRSKDLKKKPSFDGETPVITYSGKVMFRVVEIISENKDLEVLDEVDTHFSQTVVDKLNEEIRKSLQGLLDNAIEHNVDMFDYDNIFSGSKSKKWQSFKQKYPEPKEFLTNMKVQIDVKMEGKY